MGFNDFSEWPRNIIRLDALTNTAKTISATPIKVSGIIISEQAGASEIVRFREVDDDPEYFSLNIGANETKYFPIRAEFADLEAITDSAANVDVTIFAFAASRTRSVV